MNHAGSAGSLCLGSPFGRLVGGMILNSGATGAVNIAADLTVMPQPTGAVVVLPGETWSFQAWYRDPQAGAAGFDLSDGLTVTFGY